MQHFNFSNTIAQSLIGSRGSLRSPMRLCLPNLPLFRSALLHQHSTSIVPHSYASLFKHVQHFLSRYPPDTFRGTNQEPSRVALLFPNGFDYVVAMMSVWASGCVAVPLSEICLSLFYNIHSGPVQNRSEWEHILNDSVVSTILVHPILLPKIQPLSQQLLIPLVTLDASTMQLNAECAVVFNCFF